MQTRNHTRQVDLAAVPDDVFQALLTPSAIKQWWSAARAIVIPELGGAWTAAWGELEDDPDYIVAATISAFEPPHRLVLSDYRYRSKQNPPSFEADFNTAFLVRPHGDGSRLTVIQSGFPPDPAADAFLAACEAGWETTFSNIKNYFERTGG